MPVVPGTNSPGGPMPPLPAVAWMAQRLERQRQRGREQPSTPNQQDASPTRRPRTRHAERRPDADLQP